MRYGALNIVHHVVHAILISLNEDEEYRTDDITSVPKEELSIAVRFGAS